ncbi:hypothetical protein KIN20_005636 [Parelaphostrongylus tenuis]|uniref:Uncharacterized protein n=1 Tax=Parelaphostrongylus tenuis TaxID=148309 RepID=A0AAD5MLF5_PARTN|nr:hypothetical protein KIN20_005636 [Parelaphostrongylus tenuis]
MVECKLSRVKEQYSITKYTSNRSTTAATEAQLGCTELEEILDFICTLTQKKLKLI